MGVVVQNPWMTLYKVFASDFPAGLSNEADTSALAVSWTPLAAPDSIWVPFPANLGRGRAGN